MASRPHLQHISAEIERLGGDSYIFDQIANATKMRDIAEQFIRPDMGVPYSRQMIYAWIHAGGEEREAKWAEAKRIASHIHVEDSGDILDDANPTTSAQASHVKSRSQHRKWLAGKWNDKDYGDRDGKVNVQLSVGQLHLDALRTRSAEVVEAEVELLDDPERG